MIDGGWAHSRCITPAERRDARRRTLDRLSATARDDAPSALFMRRTASVTPEGVGTALGVRGDAKVRIDSLRVDGDLRRHGLADRTLREFCALADETGVALTAEVWTREQGADAIPQDALTAWFARHGFASTGIGHTMRREARDVANN